MRIRTVAIAAVFMLIAAIFQACADKSSEKPEEMTAETSDVIQFEESLQVTQPGLTQPEEVEGETQMATEQETTAATIAEAAMIPDAVPAETEVTAEEDEIPVLPEKIGRLRDLEVADFVDVSVYIPNIYVELKYAGEENFTGERIYDFQNAYLRYGTVEKLRMVCQELEEQGLYLKIWDAFRPVSAQFALWETCPDPRYVANPTRGHSSHSRGNTVDVTLVDANGQELEMPTGFDDFTEAASRDYTKCSEEAAKNAILLETVMEKYGFHGYWGEWWHYSDVIQYDVEEIFDPNDIAVRYPKCNEFITLRRRASGYSDEIDRIYVGTPFWVLGYTGQFSVVEYNEQRGYVLTKYTQEAQG